MDRAVPRRQRIRPRVLSLASAPYQAQERQHRRFLPALGSQLSLHGGSGCGQRHVGRVSDPAGADCGGQSGRRNHPDRAARGRSRYAVRARATVRDSAYGPVFTAGLHYWQLGESHYWGHNAIIRVAPFMKHCALGRLRGRGALSGEILSHDFVEAALMRRAGWSVWIAYDLPGSFEEMPPNLLDELARDHRWCQGNLMNMRLFLMKGLHPAHRAVFMTGVMAYLSAPLWFLSLILATALVAVQTLSVPQYFVQPFQLFPLWPEWHPERAIMLFSATALLLFLPKILASLLVEANGLRGSSAPRVIGADRMCRCPPCLRRCACSSTPSSWWPRCWGARCAGDPPRAPMRIPIGRRRCGATDVHTMVGDRLDSACMVARPPVICPGCCRSSAH